VYALVRDFKARGVPIDCVGLEGHFQAGAVPNTLLQTLQQFGALGVDVDFTQLDITTAPPADYAKVVASCVNVPRCRGITVFGIRDSDTFRGQTNPLLFDRYGNRKPAYAAVLSVLSQRAPVSRVSGAGQVS